MVLATCRAVLKHEHDVEDAFQATFLILSRKARSVRASDALGGWLYRVAYRAAVQAGAEPRRRRRREAEAAAMATPNATHTAPDPDIASIVHEELDRLPDRQRLPVVLCDLEGLTYQQAAVRLRWTEPTLRHRLLKARRRLRERLTRRGITAGAVGVVLAASAAGARAAVPAALARSAVAAAVGGTASATAAALTASIIRSLLMTKLKIASAGVLAAMTLAMAGVVAVGAWRTDEPKSAMRARGVAKATAVVAPTPPRDTESPAPAGSGPGIEGRVVDLEGRPVAGARIEVTALWSAQDNDLSRWLDRARHDGIGGRWEGLSRTPANLTTTTDPAGLFRLADVRPDQLAEVLVSGTRIATAQLHVMSRDGADVHVTAHWLSGPRPIVIHARRVEYTAAPSKPIEGVVRDRDTRRPLAGIKLRAAVFDPRFLIPAWGIEATTDAQGHYRLDGLPSAPACRLFVEPGEGKPYPRATLRAAGNTPALEPVTYDFALKRGILFHGKVTDKATGRPVSGFIDAYAFEDNPHAAEFPGYRQSLPPHAPVKDGRYEVVALPGRGIIGCRADAMERYRGYVGAEAIKGYDPKLMQFPTYPARPPFGFPPGCV
jgi:RNA polymerase sigma factor (sigma-70 family)